MTILWNELVTWSFVGCNEDAFRIWTSTVSLHDLIIILLLHLIGHSGLQQAAQTIGCIDEAGWHLKMKRMAKTEGLSYDVSFYNTWISRFFMHTALIPAPANTVAFASLYTFCETKGGIQKGFL